MQLNRLPVLILPTPSVKNLNKCFVSCHRFTGNNIADVEGKEFPYMGGGNRIKLELTLPHPGLRSENEEIRKSLKWTEQKSLCLRSDSFSVKSMVLHHGNATLFSCSVIKANPSSKKGDPYHRCFLFILGGLLKIKTEFVYHPILTCIRNPIWFWKQPVTH